MQGNISELEGVSRLILREAEWLTTSPERGSCNLRAVECVGMPTQHCPPTCVLFLLSVWKADLAVPTAFDPHVRSLQNQNRE